MADDELIREIDEDLRRDRFERIWREFGQHILGLSVAVVVVTIAIVLWQDHMRTKNTEATAHYMEASFLFSHEKYQEAAEKFAAIREDASGGIADMAGLRQGQALLAQGQTDKAIALFNDVAENSSDPAISGMAGLLAVTTQAQKPGSKIPALDKALVDSKNPFFSTARELEALRLMKEGKKDEAAALLHALAEDAKTPPTLRTRAEMLASTLK